MGKARQRALFAAEPAKLFLQLLDLPHFLLVFTFFCILALVLVLLAELTGLEMV